MKLDPRCEAAVDRWVSQAPPLSEKQKDVVAAAFRGAIKRPKGGTGGPGRGSRTNQRDM